MIQVAGPLVGKDELSAIEAVLESGILTAGPQTELFESEFADYVGVREAIAVSSGTSALVIALMAAGIGQGSEVIVPSFTFAATANAVRLVGGTPIFVDIDPATFCIAPESVESAISSRTEGILPVHLFGHSADMEALEKMASSHGLLLLEDAAQAHGSRFRGHRVGGLSHAGAFSFYPTKNMTTGEGGMVTTNDAGLARQARLLRNQGMAERYVHEIVGMNARMSEVAAAMGRIQLSKLDAWNTIRRSLAGRYSTALTGVETPTVAKDVEHVFNQYTIRAQSRDGLVDELTRASIGHAIYYRVPTHRQAPYAGGAENLPATDLAADQVLSLPMRPDLKPAEVKSVCSVVNSFVNRRRR